MGSNFEHLVRRHAEMKFGTNDSVAVAKWVGYWTDTLSRNLGLISGFRARNQINFRDKMVLDVGCGTGGLSKIVTAEGGRYIGCDLFPAALEMAAAFISDLPQKEKCSLLRSSGTSIPLADRSVDIVVAFDVIEHFEGGWDWQLSFLREIRRVLRCKGVLLLTTPNRLYPYEGHTFLLGPQYLPVWLADQYIRWRNPSFLQEHGTYGEIKLLNPWQLKRLLRQSDLELVHDFPFETDLENLGLRRVLLMKILTTLGLGWSPTSSFWFTACRTEDWDKLRPFRIMVRRPSRFPGLQKRLTR
jgi:SAM-dependent methyltransferase